MGCSLDTAPMMAGSARDPTALKLEQEDKYCSQCSHLTASLDFHKILLCISKL